MILLKRISRILKKMLVGIVLIFLCNFFMVMHVGQLNNSFAFNKSSLKEFLAKDVLALEEKKSLDLKWDLDFRQKQKNTCGPASLRYILSYYGIAVSEEELCQQMEIDEKGTSLLTMAKTLEDYGLKAEGLKVNFTALKELKKPLIAYINQDHYVVIYKTEADSIFIYDPSDSGYYGRQIHIDSFIANWGWQGVVLDVGMQAIEVKN